MADKGKKVGRNKTQCQAYRTSQRAEFNKARRMIRYLRKKLNDWQAWDALEKLNGVLYGNHRSALKMDAFLKTRPATAHKPPKARNG